MDRRTDPDAQTQHILLPDHQPGIDGKQRMRVVGGLTKREYFASAILAGVMASGRDWADSARLAVHHADELVEALNRREENES